MTQKEKLARAAQFAHIVKSTGNTIIEACNDYDEKWALSYGKYLVDRANEFLKIVK